MRGDLVPALVREARRFDAVGADHAAAVLAADGLKRKVSESWASYCWPSCSQIRLPKTPCIGDAPCWPVAAKASRTEPGICCGGGRFGLARGGAAAGRLGSGGSPGWPRAGACRGRCHPAPRSRRRLRPAPRSAGSGLGASAAAGVSAAGAGACGWADGRGRAGLGGGLAAAAAGGASWFAAAGGAMTMVRVVNLPASGEGCGPTAIGASHSSARCASSTAAASSASPRQGGRGTGGRAGRAWRGHQEWIERRPRGSLGTLPPVQSV